MRRVTLTGSLSRLFSIPPPDLKQLEAGARSSRPPSPLKLVRGMAMWLRQLLLDVPSRALRRDAIKNVVALTVCAMLTFIHGLRFKNIAPGVVQYWEANEVLVAHSPSPTRGNRYSRDARSRLSFTLLTDMRSPLSPSDRLLQGHWATITAAFIISEGGGGALLVSFQRTVRADVVA